MKSNRCGLSGSSCVEEEEDERFFDEDTGRWKSVLVSVGGVRTRVLVGRATLDTSVFC